MTWAIAAGLVIPGGYAIANGFSGAILGFIGYGAVNAVAAATTLSVARRAAGGDVPAQRLMRD